MTGGNGNGDDIGDKDDPGGPGRTEYEPIGEPKDDDIYVPSKDPEPSNGNGDKPN